MRTGPLAKTLEERHLVRRAKLLKRLLVVVDELLAEGTPYASVPIEQIIQRADISRSSFYRYFSDKNDLLLGLSETALGDIPMAMQGIWRPPGNATIESLTDEIIRMVSAFRPHANLMKALAGAAAYDADIEARYRALFLELQRVIAGRIRSGQRDGTIRRELSPEPVAAMLTAIGERVMTQLMLDADDKALRKLMSGFAEILWFTLYDGQDGNGARAKSRA